MTEFFSTSQKKALNFIWILCLLITFFYCSNYFISFYGPETNTYDYIYKIQGWLLHSLIFGWYFYRNSLVKKAVIIQLLFIPYYILRKDLYLTLDYYLDIDNSSYIDTFVRFFTFTIPIVYFAISYFKNEVNSKPLSKLKVFLPYLSLVIVMSFIIESDVDQFFSFFTFIGDSPYIQDLIVCFIFLLIGIKTALVLAAFFYISNRIYSLKKILNPIEEHSISSNFFKWGFVISYTILLMSIVDLGSNSFRISMFAFNDIEFSQVLFYFSSFFVLLVSGRFLGNLIQFRNYSLKKYLGVINSLSVLPVFNLIPFLVLIISKKNPDTIEHYITKLKTKRNIHLIIYSIFIVLLICYNYFSKETSLRNSNDFYQIPIQIITIILLSRFKFTTKIIPFALVGFTFYEDIKEILDFTKGYLFFIEDKIFSFLWLAVISIILIYYLFYYILHKSFYTEYFQYKNELEFEEHIKQFQ
ncbi:hypothetical protein L1276_004480 [Flavobacterium sp. HSC-32F16]|uniref:hypothetical protein n=1 Tax=Flavobacterium sp. HSC-32F16 TaxID=2910964 RepID=UPI0020A27B67|nr:hypothetical protein [Flavobacterium sp. HSC-32F16]MCP2029296.1 hypothetical protein [Flavobacterium sp. HSC-32F16]